MKTSSTPNADTSTACSNEYLYFQVKRGDMAAFDLLYTRHKRGLFKLIFSYLKNTAETEEVFHDAFIQCLDSREIGFDTGSFQNWLNRIAKNICINRLRSRKRNTNALSEFEIPDAPESAESQLISHDQDLSFQSAIDTVPKHLDDVLKLRLSGLAHQEIAVTLNIPVGTVKSRFHSLVIYLRTAVESFTDSEKT